MHICDATYSARSNDRLIAASDTALPAVHDSITWRTAYDYALAASEMVL
jgi:hypothetical protein